MTFAISFSDDAGETAERVIHSFAGFCVEITTASGLVEDFILQSYGEWDGHTGFPIQVRRCNAVHAPIGPIFTVDAVGLLIH